MAKKIIVEILRAPIGGIRKHVYDILSKTPSDSFDYIFITNTTDADYPVPTLKNLRVYNLDIQEKPSVRDFINLIQIFRILRCLHVDVVHGHGAKGGLYARLVAFLLRTKCIYTPHGGSLHRVHGKIKNYLYDLIEVLLIPLTDVFLFESAYSRDIFIRNILDVSAKSVVNYNGIDISDGFTERIYRPGNTLTIASFGLLRNLKGHDIAIEACALLRDHGVPFHYVIYGKGEEEGRLKQMITMKGLEDKVEIHDYTQDVPGEMLKYDFILHPSRFESFGYVPVEAMALKIPVVTSQEGGLKEVVDAQTGFVARQNGPEEYFRIFSDIYAGKISVQDKVAHGHAKVMKNFTLKQMIERITEIYTI